MQYLNIQDRNLSTYFFMLTFQQCRAEQNHSFISYLLRGILPFNSYLSLLEILVPLKCNTNATSLPEICYRRCFI